MVSGDIRSSSERGDLQPQMLRRWAVLILPSHSSVRKHRRPRYPPPIHELGALWDLKENFGLTEFLVCMWLTEVPGITLYHHHVHGQAATRTASSPASLSTTAGTLTETLSKSHVWWLLKGRGGGEEELQDINIYVHVRSLEGFVIESSLPINEAIFCSTQYIFSSVCPPAELWQIDAGPVYLFIRHPGD